MLRESDEVTEALRRIPEHIRDERNYRISRALLINASHSILPKEEWMTFDKVNKSKYRFKNETIQNPNEHIFNNAFYSYISGCLVPYTLSERSSG